MNSNLLGGLKCPKCGHEESLRIAVDVVMRVYDYGSGEILSDICWDDDSYCECDSCSYHATVREFQECL